MDKSDLALHPDLLGNNQTSPEGVAWLNRLPAQLATVARRWQLTLHPPYAHLSYNYVAPVTCHHGRPAVLKLGWRLDELAQEMEALALCAGNGLVRLLRSDAREGALLLDRLLPGTTLASSMSQNPDLDDETATRILAQTVRRIQRPLPAGHGLRSVTEWAAGLGRLRQRFAGGTGPLPTDLVARAESLFTDLFASAPPPVLLHGDLQHYNVLRTGSEWLGIDPKGMTGEPAYDVGALFWNPMGIHRHPLLETLQARRVAVLAEELGIDRERIAAHALAQAVLSAWWSVDDGGDPGPAIRIARSLLPLQPGGSGNLST